MSLEQELRAALAEKFLAADDVARLKGDDDLFDHLDSVQVLRLVAHLEKAYGIIIEDAEIGELTTLNQAVAFLNHKRSPSTR